MFFPYMIKVNKYQTIVLDTAWLLTIPRIAGAVGIKNWTCPDILEILNVGGKQNHTKHTKR